MKLKPLGWRVLVKPVTLEEDVAMPETLKKMGLKISAGLGENDQRRAEVALEQGTIAAIGQTAFHDASWGWSAVKEADGSWKCPVEVGQKVWFGKYAGKLIPDPETGDEYMLLLDEDLQCEIGV